MEKMKSWLIAFLCGDNTTGRVRLAVLGDPFMQFQLLMPIMESIRLIFGG